MSKKESTDIVSSDATSNGPEEPANATPAEVAGMSAKDLQALVHKLQVHQIELDLQNEELRDAQAKLIEARDRYLELYEFAPVGYLALDQNHVVREANLTAAGMLGVERQKLVGQKFARWVTPEHRNTCHLHLQKVLDTATKEVCELPFRRHDGTRFFARLEIAPIPAEDAFPAGCRVTVSDISEHKRVEDQLRSSRADLEARVRERTTELSLVNKELEIEIDDREKAENAVKTERQRLHDVLEMLPAYVVLLTPDYHVAFANRTFRERFGESGGRRCFEFLFDRTEPCENCETYKVLETKTPHHWEWTGPDHRDYQISDFLFTDSDGSNLILEMGIDVTERKRAEREVHRASLYSRTLLEASLDPLVTISPEGRITDVNQAAEEATGLARAQLIGSDFFNYFSEPDKAREGYQKVLAEGLVRDYPLTLRHTSGRTMEVLYNATVYKDEQGAVQGVFAAARDITEHKAAQQRRSDERLREAIAATGAGYYEHSADFTSGRIDRRAAALIGFTPEEMPPFPEVADWLADRIHPDDLPRVRARLDDFLAGRTEQYDHEYRMRAKDDAWRWLRVVSANVQRDAGGRPLYLASLAFDITDRKESEEALARAKRDWERTFDSVPDLIAILDPQHRILAANRAMAQRLGAEPEQCVGLTCYTCVHGLDGPPEFCPHVQSLADGQEHVVEVHEDRLGGDFLVSCTPLLDQQGHTIGSVHVARDITERKRAEAEIRSVAQFPQENPNPVLRANRDGAVLYANAPARAMLEAMDWHEGTPLPGVLMEPVRSVLREGHFQELDVICPRGRVWSFSLSPSAEQGHVNLYARDITDRRKKEEELRKLNRTLKAQSSSNQAMMRAGGESEYLREVCRIIVEDCGHAMVWIGSAEHDDAKTVRPVAHAGFEKGYLDTMRVSWADTEHGRGPTGTAIRSGRPAICRNVLTDPNFAPWRDEAVRRGYASSIALPLLADGKAFGAMMIYSREPDPFSDNEVGLLTDLATDLALGIQIIRLREAHARAEDAVRRSELDLNRAQAVAVTGSWRMDVQRNVLIWSDENHRIFGIPKSTPLSYEAFLAAIHPDDRPYVNQKWNAALRGEPYDVEHRILVDGDVKWVRERAELELDDQGALLGGFGTTQDITQRKRQEERLELLSEVNAQLLASDQPQQLVESLCRRVMEHLDCHVFFNFLVDEQAGRLRLNACAGVPEERARQMEWLDYGAAVCGCVARDGNRIVAEHIQTTTDPRADFVRSLGIQAYACHSLMNQGRVIGTLSFGSRSRPAFAEDELSLMQAVTDHVAIAMQRIRLLETLERHAQAAEAANEAKSQFLAGISHELRTPMNAILGMTDLALGQTLPATVRDYLQTAKDSADLLLELLDQVLDFSRIEAGRFDLESTPFSVCDTAEQVVKALGVRAYEKGLELVCDLPEKLPERVLGDPLRLRQILMNLLGNAIKFTAKGEIVVRVSIEEQTAESISLQFSVIDTGVGISPEAHQRIFAPFTQADPLTARQYGGSGLGLAICQRLVSLMGGQIWVESQPHEGSTFCFTLRLPICQDSAGAEQGGVGVRDVLRDVPALVVASSATSGRVLKQMLWSWAVRPEVVGDANEGLAEIERAAAAGGAYRLVLVDAALPQGDGFTLARRLQAAREPAAPVILMLSSADRQNFSAQCQDLDAHCLEKPISRSALLEAVLDALGLDELATLRAAHKGPVLSAAPARILRVLLVEDTPANQKLVLHVLGNRGHVVEVASNGQQALDLLQERDYDVVLMDVRMPEMDGFQATAAVRKLVDARKARIPIIAMTAHALKGDQERCLDAGMDAYLSKPIKAVAMIETVERVAGLAQDSQPVSQPESTEAAPTAQDPTSVFNLDEGVHRCYGKYELFRDMVGYLFEEAEPLVARMQNAVAQRNAKELAEAAHRLLGTVVFLGAEPAASAAKRVERIGRSDELSSAGQAIADLERHLAMLKDAIGKHRTAP